MDRPLAKDEGKRILNGWYGRFDGKRQEATSVKQRGNAEDDIT
jgi:hypothetical protein